MANGKFVQVLTWRARSLVQLFVFVNRLSIIILFNLFLIGCDVGQTSKPYEFKDKEEKRPDAKPKTVQPDTSATPNGSRNSNPSNESRQDPNKPFAQDENNVVKGKPLHAFPHIQFPEWVKDCRAVPYKFPLQGPLISMASNQAKSRNSLRNTLPLARKKEFHMVGSFTEKGSAL